MDKLHYLLEHLSFRDGIPVHKMNKAGEIEYSVEWKEEANPFIINRNFSNYLIGLWEKKKIPLIVQEEFGVFCGVIGDGDGNYYFWGPISENPMTGLQLRQYKNRHGINSIDFCMKKASLYAVSNNMDIFYLVLEGVMLEEIQIIKSSMEETENVTVQDTEIDRYRFQNNENDVERISYKTEQDIMEAIRTGNIEFLKKLPVGIGLEKAGRLAENEKKHQEYMTVSGITMATRAAIEGGMAPSEAYSLSDLYLQKLEHCGSVIEMINLSHDAITDFVSRVRKVQERKDKNSYVEQCKDYIACYIHKPIRVEDIAQTIGLNRCYLSKRFHESEGISIQDYITNEKIRVAKNMLKYSDADIAMIGEWLCYHSQSRFGSVFKKVTGMTPSEYRNKNKTVDFVSYSE